MFLQINSKNNTKHIFFGNIQPNNIECDEDRVCEVYGYFGWDKIFQKEKYNTLIIKDFRNNKNSDKLFIEKDFEKIEVKKAKFKNKIGTLINITYDDWFSSPITKQVFLEGVSESDVEGWIKQAKKNLKLDKNLRLPNPIQIE